MKSYIVILACISILTTSCAKDETTGSTEPEQVINPKTTTYSVLKSGLFNGANGYPSSGTAQLIKDTEGGYGIVLEKDFSTSFATGSVTMYLSKTAQPTFNDPASFIKLAVIDKKGLHRFDLKEKPDESLINVVVWCQPAGIKFGHAELK